MIVPRSTFRLTARSRDFARYVPTFLANGCFSTASSPRGTDGVLTLIAGLMDRTPGDVSRPAAVPSWAEIDCFNGAVWLNQTALTPAGFLDYEQTLNMYDGVLTTSYVWAAAPHPVRVAVTTFVSQAAFHLAATRLTLTPQSTGMVRLRFSLRRGPSPVQRLPLARLSWKELKDVLASSNAATAMPLSMARPAAPPREILTWLDLQESLAADGQMLALPDAAAPTRAAVWYPGEVTIRASASLGEMWLHTEGAALNGSAFSEAVAIELPAGLPIARSRVLEDRGGTIIEIEAELEAGRAYSFTKHVSVSREGWRDGVTSDVARAAAARTRGYARLLEEHTAAWHNLWRADIVVDGDPALQRIVHSDLFYLLQNSNPEVSWPMGACGLSPNYFGHVFWDCDNWVFPVLLLLHPERAKHLVTFRRRTLEWALGNAARRGVGGVAFPWEADPETGAEETPRYAGVNAEREVHLNADIAIAQWQYFLATGDLTWLREDGFPVMAGAADFYAARATYDPKRERYELLGVTSVDEKYTDVNNDAYTNAAAWRCLTIAGRAAEALGLTPPAQWEEVAAKLYIPFSKQERRHLVFDPSVPHDRRTWMAGALTLLAAPYLDLPMPDDVRRHDYEYAVQKAAELSPEPNQMMLAMFAVHAATLGNAEGALRWLRPTEHEFLMPPFNMRGETPRNNCVHHLAAACGILQALMYGFTGLRITEEGLAGTYAPILPQAWASLSLTGVEFRGSVFDVVVARGEDGAVRLTRQAPVSP
ncbi:MAG TPA: glycoside hydrolase family 65 protein [bacterium]